MTVCSEKARKITVFSCGGIFIVLGIILAITWSVIFKIILKSQLILAPDSTNFNLWKETPIPMYLEIHLFNWTNPTDVKKDWKVKPIFEEVGPYVFSEKHIRVNLTWNDNGTVTFQQKRFWQFEPDMSVGQLTDKIQNINVIVATVANMIKNKHYLIRRAVDIIMREEEGSHLEITKTVGEILFDGYEDPLLKLVKKLNISGFVIPFDKFGWFYGRNGSETYDGTFSIDTGANNLDELGIVKMWNGVSKTHYYPGGCGIINGTTGELWPPVHQAQKVSIFASDICSSMSMSFAGMETIRGVEGRKYVATAEDFDSGALFPDQECFNVGDKVPSGTRNVSSCRFGAPAFISYPHFYLADAYYRDAVEGMNPNKTLHEMYMSIESSTGIPLDVSARMQINIRIQKITGLQMFENVETAFIPMLWFTQRATLTEDLASQARMLLVLPNLGEYTGYGLLAFGVLLSAIGMYITLRKGWKGTEAVSLIPQDKF